LVIHEPRTDLRAASIDVRVAMTPQP